MKKILISIGSVAALGLPLFAFADATPKLDGYLGKMISQASTLVGQLLGFLIGLAVVWFIWNVIKYSMSKEEDGKEKAKTQMIHGIIAIAVIASVWGIVGILQAAFGVNSQGTTTNYSNMIPGGSSASAPTTAPAQSGSVPFYNENGDPQY